MKNFACFDIGGSSIKYGLLDETGRILHKGRIPTPQTDCRNTILTQLIHRIKNYEKEFNIDGVGISTAGLVDTERGEIIFASDNLPGYTGARLAHEIFEKTGLHASVENDVNAAAIGEMWKGAAVNEDDFVCLTIGTGIGSAIVLDRKLYRGKNKIAGWFGHMVINENGAQCNCGNLGCYEKYASTNALINMYLSEITDKNIAPEIDGEYILQEIRDNQAIAKKVFSEFIDHIVTGLVNVTYILDPGLIILGGGITEEGDMFIEKIRSRFNQKCMPAYSSVTRIEKAYLGNDSGLYGACYLSMSRQI